MTAAIVFIIFNRPNCTRQVFERIRKARPQRLLVVADGARSTCPADLENCRSAREIVDRGVDWDCELLRNYSSVNLGCRNRVSTGLDWAFQKVEEAIILEDDCLPHPSFFRFCDELLVHYRNDTRVMMISGHNERSLIRRIKDEKSYFFTSNVHIWGWATWRRAWKFYDVEMAEWPNARNGRWLNEVLTPQQNPAFWYEALEKVYRGEIDTWDWQWSFACWMQRGLSIIPNRNMIANIGFGTEATHTTATSKVHTERPVHEMRFPLVHQNRMIGNAMLNYRAVGLPSAMRQRLRRLKSRLGLRSGT